MVTVFAAFSLADRLGFSHVEDETDLDAEGRTDDDLGRPATQPA